MRSQIGILPQNSTDDLRVVAEHNGLYGLAFYVALAREAQGPVLDVACGTGRILLPCLQAGVDIEVLDLFEPMIRGHQIANAALIEG